MIVPIPTPRHEREILRVVSYRNIIFVCLLPAFCSTTCASIDLLMLEEQTVPKDNFDGRRRAEGGGTPGGVEGR